MKHLTVTLLVAVGLAAALASAQGKQTFNGTITDDMCAKADHSQMRMGSTDEACAAACADDHGAMYGLYDGNEFYTLSDQRTSGKFAGKKVRVVGTLDAKTKTIQVDSITIGK